MRVELKLGDCLERTKDISDSSVDLIVTSPPYDNLRTYNGYTFDFEGIARELVRVLKPGGVIVWVVNDATVKGSETGTSFRQALYFMNLGLNLHDTMIYQKLNPLPLNHNRYEQSFEYMFVMSKGKPKTVNHIRVPCKYAGTGKASTYYKTSDSAAPEKLNTKGLVGDTKIRDNIWQYLAGNHGDDAKYKHPAKFPLQLAIDHVQSWSSTGDVVLDPFLGSGTTGVAALQLGRDFIGIEISAEYLEIAKQRIDSEVNNFLQQTLPAP